MQITKDDFELWKEHSVTKKLYDRLQMALDDVDAQLKHEGNYTQDGLLVLKRLCGIKEALNQILTLEAEDLLEDEN